ncbi:MAG TPA: hypothetical protein VKR62_01145, partial [Roseiarcus sp.]|nr:hypothetical protein [Roseiarcus sp.]
GLGVNSFRPRALGRRPGAHSLDPFYLTTSIAAYSGGGGISFRRRIVHPVHRWASDSEVPGFGWSAPQRVSSMKF